MSTDRPTNRAWLRRPAFWAFIIAALSLGAVIVVRARGPVVRTARVRRADLEQHIVSSGRVWVPTRAQISAQAPGLVVEVGAAEGQHVSKGELLVQLDDADSAEQMLRAVGLEDRMNFMATDLSGGQQQRVAIARALAHGPRLVLADEPTGNLDTKSADEVFALMRRFNDETGTTFIVVTHDLRIAARCKRTVEIVDGRVHQPA